MAAAEQPPMEASAREASEPVPATETEQPIEADELITQLQQDRLWLLRQLDAGSWPDWRLDLAALERELGQLLEQVHETFGT